MIDSLAKNRVTSSVPAEHGPAGPLAVPDETKRREFDRYWETRNLTSTDARTRLRLALVESMLVHRRGSLLDVGCGRGVVAGYFAERDYTVTAIDISPLAIAWTHRQHPAIRTAVVDLECEPVFGTYDVILCLEVLQQVRDPASVLRRLTNALTPDGEMVVSLPNEFHLARRLAIRCGRIDFGGIDDTHIKLYTPSEHHRLFAACGLTVTGARAQSIVPPRWWRARLHQWTNPLAERLPGLFALSAVYRLTPASAGGEAARD